MLDIKKKNFSIRTPDELPLEGQNQLFNRSNGSASHMAEVDLANKQ